jgi:hypothetical protein
MLTSVVMVPLLGGTANNAVLESISSNIPAFVSRLPSTEEYLGRDYPMFFDSLDEVSRAVEDEDRLFELMERTHQYLVAQPKERLLPENFQFQLANIARGVRKECPASQSLDVDAERAASPSARRPFFFFHIPKVGGTSLRSQLAADATRLQQELFAPCFRGVPCTWWGTPGPAVCEYGDESNAMACAHREEVSRATIFAGHFGTKMVGSLRGGWRTTHGIGEEGGRWQGDCDEEDPLSCVGCLVMLREPVDRLIDAYTFFDDRAKSVPFEKLTVEELMEVTRKYGPNVTLAYLGDGEYDPQDMAERFKQPPRGGDIAIAKATIDRCSLGIFERWSDSQALWRTEIPWSSVGVTEVRAQQGPSHVTSEQLPEETQSLLRRVMAADVELYQHALQSFDSRFAARQAASAYITDSSVQI